MFIYRAYLNTTKVVAPPIVIRLFFIDIIISPYALKCIIFFIESMYV